MKSHTNPTIWLTTAGAKAWNLELSSRNNRYIQERGIGKLSFGTMLILMKRL